jgi:hypothetical protein
VGVGGYQGQPQGARSNSVGFGRFAFAETFGWKQGLDSKFTAARVFYAVVVLSTLTGVFVSVFDTDGNLLQHFAQHGHLSSPWGVSRPSPRLRPRHRICSRVGSRGGAALRAHCSPPPHRGGLRTELFPADFTKTNVPLPQFPDTLGNRSQLSLRRT